MYRVKYTGSESTAAVGPEKNDKATAARETRKKLEAFHVKKDPAAIEVAWPHLNSADRSLCYAARVAIETQSLQMWQEKAILETKTNAAIQLGIALARSADRTLQPQVIHHLNSLPLERMTEEQLLGTLRAYGLSFIRQRQARRSRGDERHRSFERPLSTSERIRESRTCALLVYLEWPGVATPSMKLLSTSQTQEDQLYYVLTLRNVVNLLSHDERRAYVPAGSISPNKLTAAVRALRNLIRIREDAVLKLTPADRIALKDVIEDKNKVEAVKLETTRQFIHNWQMEDLNELVAKVETGRNFEKGKRPTWHAMLQVPSLQH